MESTLKDLKSRHSVRAFTDESISKEDLDKILEVGSYAPSGIGKQSPKILVTQDKELIAKLSKMNALYFPEEAKSQFPEDFDPFYGANTLIIVLADSNIPTYVEDGSLVIGNILNAAYALDLGACWIHRAREEFESEEGKELLKKWSIPDSYKGIGHVILGHPAEELKSNETPRKKDYITYLDDI